MPVDAWFSVTTVAVVVIMLVTTRLAPDVILMSALTGLLVTGVLSPADALAGFANPGVITIGALYIVAAALRETGAIRWVAGLLLGQPVSLNGARLRMMLPVAVLSAFMNNTSVVAIFIPAIQEWASRLRLPSSGLLLPLSYISILGGLCTLIGTSTNLVVDGLLQTSMDRSIGMFEMAPLGIILVLAGGGFMMLAAGRLLPIRESAIEQFDMAREYAVECRVIRGGPLVGKTIAEAGLRHLRHGYLADIEREGHLLSAVSPEMPLQSDDVLIFIGEPECAVELRQIRGITPDSGNIQKLDISNHQRRLVEVVIGPDFTGVGQTVREAGFRTRFQAVIISMSRHGRRLTGKLGNHRFEVGDTLLLETGEAFVSQYRYRRDFLLVSPLRDVAPPDFRRAPLALGILGVMVILAATTLLPILQAALLAAGAMIFTGCVGIGAARRQIDLSVLIVIAASLALGSAMTQTGAATIIADLLTRHIMSPWAALAAIYILTAAFTETMTNNAAAVLMFPVATATASQLGVDTMPYIIAIMVAASASFMTPLGYQTNLMVYGPGGYRGSDYFRLGLPMSVVVGILTIGIIPFLWRF